VRFGTPAKPNAAFFSQSGHNMVMRLPLHLKPTLRRFNNLLTVLVVLLGLYIVLGPFLPLVGWWLHPPLRTTAVVAQQSHEAPIPADNRLKIPRIGLDETINTGPSIVELRKGVWLIPKGSHPDQKSNSVIVGHRFTYAGPAVFYFLDRVQQNDLIMIDWERKEYIYKVSAIDIVPPSDTAVEKPTPDSRLTLYTCTPLWTAKNRLVITAPLERIRS
jgi:sortase A